MHVLDRKQYNKKIAKVPTKTPISKMMMIAMLGRHKYLFQRLLLLCLLTIRRCQSAEMENVIEGVSSQEPNTTQGYQLPSRSRRTTSNLPPVDYGGSHPFEIMHRQRQLFNNATNSRHLNERSLEQFNPDTYQPIRFATEFFLPAETSSVIRTKNVFITSVVAQATSFWSSSINVFRAQQPLQISKADCTLASDRDQNEGVPNVDLMLYIVGELNCGDGTFAAAGSCYWDQFDRPIGGKNDKHLQIFFFHRNDICLVDSNYFVKSIAVFHDHLEKEW